jgi:thioredoxin reductase/NAD-dependent dihydropyrimidine dehydrogenase PreA subunit
MISILDRYARWLHTGWPAGKVEPLPETGPDGITRVSGISVAGDLSGIPLLKFAIDGGVRAVRRVASNPGLRRREAPPGTVDLAILGAGVAGMAAAVEAQRLGLSFTVIEASEPFATIANFPRAKPIYTYPMAMKPAGDLQVSATVKEPLLEDLRAQAAARRIVPVAARAERIESRDGHVLVHLAGMPPLPARHALVAIGRSGNYRKLGVPGEDSGPVYNRLHDPADFTGRRVLVVGGGDSALEAAIALAGSGAAVTLAHRGREFTRPKPENVEKIESLQGGGAAAAAAPERAADRPAATAAPGAAPAAGSLRVRLATRVREVREREVVIEGEGGAPETLANDAVFALIGREAPLDFFRRSGLAIAGEMSTRRWLSLGLFALFCSWLYNWKSGGFFTDLWYRNHWFPTNLPDLLAAAGGAIAVAAKDRGTLLGTLAISAASPSFYYTVAYSVVVTVFGIQRIRRRKTPYITAQTLTLMAVQVVPLFLLPEILLPLLDANGLLPRAISDALFPVAHYGHGREFWRAYGLILAWPLNVYNIFTHEPLWWWIGIGFVQTCVLIPLAVYWFGKGAYCGWICSCGALAETLGDTHRHKMPHGPGWNRLNMAGQGVLAIAVVLLVVRIAGWSLPDGNSAERFFEKFLEPQYKWVIDVFLAGVVGYGVYFWFSGRFWCRFLCPLAALMNVYARFSRFRIFADKKKCISCNVCTSVCHQGIDVMSFANKGLPMADPQCVRCSACVQSCPTGVLSFGQLSPSGLISIDSLAASPVRMREG